MEMSTLQVEDLMEDQPATLKYSGPEQKAQEAADLMNEKGVETLVLVDEGGRPLGLVTAQMVEQAAGGARLREVMAAEIEPLKQRHDLLTATHMMANSDYDSLPVVNAKGRVVGILTAMGLTGVFSARLNQPNGSNEAANEAPPESEKR